MFSEIRRKADRQSALHVVISDNYRRRLGRRHCKAAGLSIGKECLTACRVLINIETAIITPSLLVEMAGLDAHSKVYWRRAIERVLGLSGRQSFNEKKPRRVQGSDHPFVSSMPSGLLRVVRCAWNPWIAACPRSEPGVRWMTGPVTPLFTPCGWSALGSLKNANQQTTRTAASGTR